MSDWYARIEDALGSIKQGYRTWETGDGRLLVLSHGARILACELPNVEGDLFWHSPAVEDPKSIVGALTGAGGGLGGDRLWLAPEIGFMWQDLAEARVDPLGGYHVPEDMDPSQWTVLDDAPDLVALETQVELQDYRMDKRINVRVGRRFSLIKRPAELDSQIKCVSFAICNEVFLNDGDNGAAAGAWDLLQVPPEGWIICPVVSPVAVPRSYYDPFGAKHVTTDARAVRFLVDGKHRIKMGLTPMQTTGRMGYFRKAGHVATLIVRVFGAQPGDTYVDLPRDSDDLVGGDALQCYNDDGGAGGFGEMEYHDPAVVVGEGPLSRFGSCVTHVMAGPEEAIRVAGKQMLGVSL